MWSFGGSAERESARSRPNQNVRGLRDKPMLRKRLIWQLYPSFLAITLVALVVATAYCSYTLQGFYLDQVERKLHLAADVAASQVETTLDSGTPAEVDALCKKLGRSGDGQMRLTVIAASGKVLGDSDDNPAEMEDHSNRVEITNALREGYGQSMRPSPTLGKNMMYVAIPVIEDDQPIAVVRTAVFVTDIDRTLHGIYVSIVWAGLIVVLCAAFLSLLISRRISVPITRMKRIAQLFADGQLNIRVPAAGAAELDDLAKALNEMATQLQDRILTITRAAQ